MIVEQTRIYRSTGTQAVFIASGSIICTYAASQRHVCFYFREKGHWKQDCLRLKLKQNGWPSRPTITFIAKPSSSLTINDIHKIICQALSGMQLPLLLP